MMILQYRSEQTSLLSRKNSVLKQGDSIESLNMKIFNDNKIQLCFAHTGTGFALFSRFFSKTKSERFVPNGIINEKNSNK